MARFATLILILFLFAGISLLMDTVVTGTTAGETVARTIFPLLVAVVAVGTLWRLFK